MSYVGELERQLSEKRKQIQTMREQIARFARYLNRDVIYSQQAQFKAEERREKNVATYWGFKVEDASRHLQQLERSFPWLVEALSKEPGVQKEDNNAQA